MATPEGMPDGASPGPEVGCTTVEITFGTSERTSRVELKKRMSAFGEVDVCHMGTRGKDFPFVRFRSAAFAEAAVEALKSGQVFLEDGSLLGGGWKLGSRRREPLASDNRRRDETEDMTSRNLINVGRGEKGRGLAASPSRSVRRLLPHSRSRRKRSRSKGRSRKRRHGSRSRHRRTQSRRSNSRHRRDSGEIAGGDSEAAGGPDGAPVPMALPGSNAVGYSNPLFMRRHRAL